MMVNLFGSLFGKNKTALLIKRDHEDADKKPLKHFRLEQPAVDIQPMLQEVAKNADLWLASTGRQDTIKVQRETNSIPLRGAVNFKNKDGTQIPMNQAQESDETGFAKRFPVIMKFMYDFAKSAEGELQRAIVVRLQPGGHVYGHIDEGSYYAMRDRYHLVLESPTGSILTSGGETVRMWPAELWWFDNKAWHESANDSVDWRVHVIFDVLPHSKQV